MKFKKIFSFIAFIIVLSICLSGTKIFLERKYSNEKYKPFFDYYKKTNFDVIFMGTSHTYNSILSQEVWDLSNICSYNWGSGCCTIPINYYLLQQICNYTSPKLIVIDLYGLVEYENNGNGKYNSKTLDQYRVQFDAFPFSKIKYQAVNDIFDDYDNRYDFLFNLAIYHNRWKEITKENFSPRDIPQNGSAFVLGHKEVDYIEKVSGEMVEINSKCLEYIPLIYNFCEENNIKILFTYLPYTATDGAINVAHSFQQYLKDYPNCEYLNMLNSGILNYKTDMYTDGSHLNYMGAYKTTEFLANYLAKNYPELVHNDKSTSDLWNDNYKKYIDYKISRFEENQLYNNLLLAYGKDFYIKLYILDEFKEKFYEDHIVQNIINEFQEHASVHTVSEFATDSTNSNLKLELYSQDTNDLVFETLFSY